METLIKIIHFFAAHLWFTAILVFIISSLQIAIPVFNANRAPTDKRFRPYKHVLVRTILLGITMTALILGMMKLPDWRNHLVYNNGKNGNGVITRMERTNNMYNEQYVMRYFVVIKKEDGSVVTTQFESSDFNVYPSENVVIFPKVGEKFALRYLSSAPDIFVILTDKDSEYAKRLACNKAFDDVAEAKIKFEADSLNRQYRYGYVRALEKLLQTECYKGMPLEEQYIRIDKETIESLKQNN